MRSKLFVTFVCKIGQIQGLGVDPGFHIGGANTKEGTYYLAN